jgi:GDPmannose 4,6-dehydratase
MWLMLQQDEPGDYVVATGETYKVCEFVRLAFEIAEVDGWERYVRQDPKFLRPAEVDLLVGDPAKAHTQLGWKREVSFHDLVKKMVEHDLEVEGRATRYAGDRD